MLFVILRKKNFLVKKVGEGGGHWLTR